MITKWVPGFMKVFFGFIVFAMVLGFAGCTLEGEIENPGKYPGGPWLSGMYTNWENDPPDWINFFDNQFVFDFNGWQMSGTYTVSGDTVILDLGSFTITFFLGVDTIWNSTYGIFVKDFW